MRPFRGPAAAQRSSADAQVPIATASSAMLGPRIFTNANVGIAPAASAPSRSVKNPLYLGNGGELADNPYARFCQLLALRMHVLPKEFLVYRMVVEMMRREHGGKHRDSGL